MSSDRAGAGDEGVDPALAHRLGFRGVDEDDERTDAPMTVEGSLPGWLCGTLLRNGPGTFSVGDREVRHWFDGLAMVRRFAFDPAHGNGTDDADRVWYSNRFLRTEAYADATDGQVGYSEFATNSDRPALARLVSELAAETTDNALVHVARLAGEYAAVTETPGAVAFDPKSLDTRGSLRFDDEVPNGHATAHHLRDGEETWGYVTGFAPRPAYHIYRLPDDTDRRELVASVPVDQPAYVHDFGLTESFVVITETPFVTRPWKLLIPDDDPFIERYEWKPQRETRFLIVDRETGNLVAEPRVPPFFTFHHANVAECENGNELLVDPVVFDTPRAVRGMYLDRLRGRADAVAGGTLRRYRVPLDGSSPTWETVREGVSLPRIDERRRGREYRFVYAQDASERGFPQGVSKTDIRTGETTTWGREALYCGEPVFVPRPGGTDEDDGVLLTVCLDAHTERSRLVVIDAETMTEQATAKLPHALPFGFHGRYFPELTA